MITNILFTIFVFLTVWMGSIMICRSFRKLGISGMTFLLFAIGATGIITHILKVW